MRTDQAITVLRSAYRPPHYLVDTISLEFDLRPDDTRVRATSRLRRLDPDSGTTPLLLDGEALELLNIRINGRDLEPQEYRLTDTGLEVLNPPLMFELCIDTRINPQANTSLSGLYRSNGNFFTQCEAQGFRRITFYPDRPDVMARFQVTVRADRNACPVLLSNGNLLNQGACPEGSDADGIDRSGWHWACWDDPFPKPSYLFALVAGQLVATESRIQTRSGRQALLQVWVEPGNEDKTHHAMGALERSLRWDEDRYGLELDLERFMIVAVSDFNMGAMENKGLNIFNTRYVFAHPRLATDPDFLAVEAVVAHEYFHNWTGNRVTCRDWFQLTLKEGLTVFRDQQFSADMMAAQCTSAEAAASARAVKRINDVRVLRTAQFAEDAGPMAHPIRPDAYQEINNFYTVTVYEKGAEVIRMLHTLAGERGFRRGIDLYFQRHDGQAVTCDDFMAAIADANGLDLSQFGRWYSQAGTPRVSITSRWDAQHHEFYLHIEQSCPPTPGQAHKQPFQIPLALGLVGPDGRDLPLTAADEATQRHLRASDIPGSVLIDLRDARLTLRFGKVHVQPVVSAARGFSAPIIIEIDINDEQLEHLASYDSDPFNRWEASHRLALGCIRDVMGGASARDRCAALIRVWARTLDDGALDPAYKDLVLSLPAEGYIAEQIDIIDPLALRRARQAVRSLIATSLDERWRSCVEKLTDQGPWQGNTQAIGRRALRNNALSWWVEGGTPEAARYAQAQFETAHNMTDRMGALTALMRVSGPVRQQALNRFESDYAQEPLVMDKWFSIQASAHRLPDDPAVLTQVLTLLRHPAFSIRNPNKVRALITTFCTQNLAEFHAPDGSGHVFWADQVLALDAINPQVAARLARALDRWRRYTPELQHSMQQSLHRVSGHTGLSRDVAEIVSKALADPA